MTTTQRTRVKVCGMTQTVDITAATNAGVDAVGVISKVPVDSRREVSRERARTLVRSVPPFVTSVLVTMPTAAEDALDLLEHVDPDVVQLHGVQSAGLIETMEWDRPVVAALDVDDEDAIRDLDGTADAILVDSTDETGAGGTGETHDWDRAREYVTSLATPVILAGGLTPENVGSAVERVRPFAVDVASGVEDANGKDHAAIDRFVSAAQSREDT